MWSLIAILLALGPSRSDAEFVESLRNQNEEAFRALFERYHPDLYRFLIRMRVPENVTEDILQDVFLGVWMGRERLDPRRSIRAYLYRSCRNRASNHFRRRLRLVEDPDLEPASSLTAQDERWTHNYLQKRLEEAVSLLPDRRRAVFELCFMNGLTYKEAAEALEITPKTVENHMGYALKSIREYVSSHLDDQS